MSALANMPDMHSSIYSIMQDNLKSELKYYPVLGFSDAGFFSKKTLGLCHKTHKTLIIQNFALQSGLRPPHLSLWFTGQSILLRKTVYCQNFATQNRLQRQRSSLFLTAPFSSGCILCGSSFNLNFMKIISRNDFHNNYLINL